MNQPFTDDQRPVIAFSPKNPLLLCSSSTNFAKMASASDRVSPHPAWELLRQILLGDPAHTWRSALLLVVLGAVICGILLAGSVALTAAGAALVGLVGLLRLSRWQANRVRLG